MLFFKILSANCKKQFQLIIAFGFLVKPELFIRNKYIKWKKKKAESILQKNKVRVFSSFYLSKTTLKSPQRFHCFNSPEPENRIP